ncbi:MAG: NAD(P)/FAD-dependent oxidoreductase [Deltaproteobacteria bacterium]|nr:NAD(P)/FAD-dependent oxidoreductase [Deltaproteobacteria bacterium]
MRNILQRPLSRRVFLALSALSAARYVLNLKEVEAQAARIEPKANYPVVVIGSGLGGLCCAVYLARQGFPVTVLEQRPIPGGYACSFDRLDGRFTFDVSLHGMAAHNNATARILDDLGVLAHLDLIELPEIYQLRTPQATLSMPPQHPETYIQRLCRLFPEEEEGIRDFIQLVMEIAEEADRLHRKGMPSKFTFPFRYPKIYQSYNKTLSKLMDPHIKDRALRCILASLWDFHGLPPSKVSGLYYAAALGDVLKNGTYFTKRHCRDLNNYLVRALEEAGGRVCYETVASRILVQRGRVAGVETAAGKKIPARVVVSNTNIHDTLFNMLPKKALPEKYRKKLTTYRPSLSSFIVWLGLRGNPAAEVGAAGIQVLSNRGPEADYAACAAGRVEKVPFRISIYDSIYQGYSRPGTSTVRLFCLSGFGPWQKYEEDYRAGHKEAYRKEKKRCAEILIRRAEKIIPGLASAAEVIVTASPLTNKRFTRNTLGAIYGFEQSVENAYIRRIDNRTPLKGLYLAGAWCNPGGGFSGVLLSGQIAFRKIMDDLAEGV